MFSFSVLLSLGLIFFCISVNYLIQHDFSGQVSSITSSCDEHQKQSLIIHISAYERRQGKLDDATLKRAIDTFRKCGVVAMNGIIPSNIIDEFRFHLTKMMEPLIESREKIKLYSNLNWDELPNHIQNELFLSSGEAIRERQAGRLDLLLPHTMPFNASGLILNQFVLDILGEVFNDQQFELKSVHGVTALPQTYTQNWHRDDGPLFPSSSSPSPSSSSSSSSLSSSSSSSLDPDGDGEDFSPKKMKALNVYAVNMFVALDNIKLESGPTEYLLGSHIETNKNIEHLIKKEHQSVAFEWPKGSVVIMDYRTVHRGGANLSPLKTSRSLAMLVYGRLWWRDAVNYMGDNYGGMQRSPETVLSGDGEHFADRKAAAVVARRLAQRHISCPVRQHALKQSMFEYCKALWNSYVPSKI